MADEVQRRACVAAESFFARVLRKQRLYLLPQKLNQTRHSDTRCRTRLPLRSMCALSNIQRLVVIDAGTEAGRQLLPGISAGDTYGSAPSKSDVTLRQVQNVSSVHTYAQKLLKAWENVVAR